MCVGVTFRTSQLANQLAALEFKNVRSVYSHIDLVVGSVGNALVKEKVNLLHYLQDNLRTLKIYVDYSDDVISNVADEFLRENNVRFMVQMFLNPEGQVKETASTALTCSQTVEAAAGTEEESKNHATHQPVHVPGVVQKSLSVEKISSTRVQIYLKDLWTDKKELRLQPTLKELLEQIKRPNKH